MEHLTNLRIKNNYSYQQMAFFLNISKTYYWQIEHDKRKLSYNMAFEIANIFNLTPDEIFLNDFKNMIQNHK